MEAKIVGARRSWLARVASEEVPVRHQHHRSVLDDECNPMRTMKLDGARYRRSAEASGVGTLGRAVLSDHSRGAISVGFVEKVVEPA